MEIWPNSFYVDDLISRGMTIDQAFHLCTVARKAMTKAGFNLQKWHSNSQELLMKIQAESKDVNCLLPQLLKTPVNSSFWELCGTVTLTQSIRVNGASCQTSRQLKVATMSHHWYIRSLGSSQSLCNQIESAFSDNVLRKVRVGPAIIRSKFKETLIGELKILNEVKIPRCYIKKEIKPKFHGFSDASENRFTLINCL